MGGAGGSFGQSFAQTLIQGMLAQNQIQQSQADLKIKRDLADANLKQHEAQTALVENKLRAASKLASRLMPQQIGGGMEGPNTTVPGQINPQDLAEYAASTGDVSHLFKQYDPQPYDPSKGYATVIPATGQTNQIAAPQPPPMHPLAEQALRSAGFGGGQAAPAAPPVEGQPAAEGQPAPAAPSPMNPGGIRYEPPTISVDPKGGITLKTGPVKANVHIEKIEYPVGSGNYQSVAVAIDPTNPNNRQMIPLGKPLPSEQMQKFESIAESWGIPPGEVRKWAVGAIADVTTTYTGPAQAIAMEDLKAKMQGAVGKGLAGTQTTAKTPEGRAAQLSPSGTGTPLEKAQQLEVNTAGAKEAAQIQAKNANEPLQATAANKFAALQSVDRQMALVQQNFRPEFVGKGFGSFSDALKKEYDTQEKFANKGKYEGGALSGAMAGYFREYTGKISPEEVTFRKSLLDAGDLLLRARSGQQINESEYGRLKSLLPQVTDEPNVFLPAMKRFQDEVTQQMKDVTKLGSTSARQLNQELQRGGTKTVPTTAPKGFRPE